MKIDLTKEHTTKFYSNYDYKRVLINGAIDLSIEEYLLIIQKNIENKWPPGMFKIGDLK